MLIFIPDINETCLAMGHKFENSFINSVYSKFLDKLDKNSFQFEFKTGGQNLSNYFKYHTYDDLKGIISIAKESLKDFLILTIKLKLFL